MKICFKCGIKKPVSNFYKHPQMPSGTVNKCKECNKKDVKDNYAEHRAEKHEYDRYRHRYSVMRLFSHKYSMIKTRCTKVRSNGKPYRVHGMQFLTKKEWLDWCYKEENYKKFMEIYNNWVQSNFIHKLTPSIDRINSKAGYLSNNLQWLTLSQNCSKYNK